MGANPIERAARWSEVGYLERVWREANGDWMTPRDDEIRAFLRTLSNEAEK